MIVHAVAFPEILMWSEAIRVIDLAYLRLDSAAARLRGCAAARTGAAQPRFRSRSQNVQVPARSKPSFMISASRKVGATAPITTV